MSNLTEATKGIDTSQMTPAEPMASPGPPPEDNGTPQRNQFLRCPLPPTTAGPDSLRQFYGTGVPQFRVVPPSPQAVVGPEGDKGDTGARGASVVAAPTIKAAAGMKRETIPLTTGSLAAGDTETGTVALGKTFSLMSITASLPCRIRLYSSSDFRATDLALGRSPETEPLAYIQHGIIYDWNTQDDPTITSSGWTSGITNWLFQNNVTHTTLLSDEHPISGHPVLWTPGPGDVIRIVTTCAHADTIESVTAVFVNGGGTPISDAGTTPAGVSQTGPARVIPAGAVAILFTLNGSTYDGAAQWAASIDVATDPVITYPDYPVTFVCSPEAPGSDKSSSPAGDIAYAIGNLGAAAANITVNFEILREEK